MDEPSNNETVPPVNENMVRVQIRLNARKPVVTYVIAGVTIFVFLLQIASEIFLTSGDIPAVLGMKSNALILKGQLWRLFTPMLLHGGYAHILSNMYALIVIGRDMELFYGHKRYTTLYILGGFAGNVFSFLFTQGNSLGASTAIFGLIGAQAIFIYQNRKFLPNSRSMLINTLIVIGINLFLIGSLPLIDNFGHLGGLLGGAAFAWFAGPRWALKGVPPVMEVSDSRIESRTLPIALGVFMLFALVAALKFIL